MDSTKFIPRSVFGVVFVHECRMLWRTGTALILLLLMSFWIGLAVRTGTLQAQRQANLQERTKANEAAVLKKNHAAFIKDPQGYRGKPYTASLLWRQYATLPAGPLAALDVGQSDLRASVYPLYTDWEKAFMVAGPLRNESALRSGHFDAGFMVTYLLPLVVIALSFGVLAGDREKGTLILLLSQPVSTGTLLGASLLARFLLLEVIAIGSAAVFVYGGSVAGVETLPRFLLWSLVVSAYMAFWFGIAAVVVASAGKAAMNALLMVMCWVFFTVILPGGIAIAASARFPIPPRSEIMQQINVARDEAFENWRDNEKSFRRFYKDFPELIPVGARVTPQKIIDPLTNDSDFQSRVMIVIPYSLEQLGLQLSKPHQMAISHQRNFLQNARLWSPVVGVREGLMDVAGSGDARYREFDTQVANFWQRWRFHWVKPMFRGPQLTPADYLKVPQYHFREESLRALGARVLPSTAATLLMAIALWLWAVTLLRRQLQSPLSAN